MRAEGESRAALYVVHAKLGKSILCVSCDYSFHKQVLIKRRHLASTRYELSTVAFLYAAKAACVGTAIIRDALKQLEVSLVKLN